MAYCDMDDVRRLNPKRTYGASTTPTQTQVEEMVVQIAAEMDTVLLGRGMSVPVATPAELVTHLGQVNAYGAAALAELAMFPEAVGTPGGSPHGQELWRVYQQMVRFLKEGDLPSAVQAGGPFSFFTDHPTDEPTEDRAWRKPKFGKDKEF